MAIVSPRGTGATTGFFFIGSVLLNKIKIKIDDSEPLFLGHEYAVWDTARAGAMKKAGKAGGRQANTK